MSAFWIEVWGALPRSLAIAGTVMLFSGALGLVFAWLVTRTNLPGARLLAGTLSTPYAIPAYLLGMAWIVLGNPTVGLLKQWLPASGSYGFWGIVWVETTVAFAFPYLELRAGFERLDPALEEAARMSGASPLKVFRDVSFPLLKPALFNGMLLAFLYAFCSFGAPALLGLPVRQYTLTTLIYSKLKLGGVQGILTGFELSLVLAAVAASALGFSAWLSSRFPTGRLSGGKSSRPSLVRLSPLARGFAAALAWGFLFVAVLLPWGALVVCALAPVSGHYAPSEWTLTHLKYVLTLPDIREAALNSVAISLTVTVLVVAAGFVLGFLAERRGRGWAAAIVRISGLFFSTPGTVLAMAVLFVAVIFARLGLPINDPLFMIALAYGLKYAAVGAQSLALAFKQVDPVMEEAARVSGANTRELLLGVWAPLLRKSLGAAFALAVLPMFTELTMSVLLTGPGAATLGTVLFDLQEYADQPSAAALALLLLTAALLVGGASITSKFRENRATEIS